MNETQFRIKKYSDTDNAVRVTLLLYTAAGIALMVDTLPVPLRLFLLLIFASSGGLAFYIVIMTKRSESIYWFAPIKKCRLKKATEQWTASADHIRSTGDYGMCCDEETALQTSKEYYFEDLLPYADVYMAELQKSCKIGNKQS